MSGPLRRRPDQVGAGVRVYRRALRAARCTHPLAELVPIRRGGVYTGTARCAACDQLVPWGAPETPPSPPRPGTV